MKSKAQQLAEERYPYVDCGHEQLDNVTRRNIDEIRAAFIAGYEADKWIRVEDELPNEYDTVLIWDDDCVYSAIYLKGGFEDEHGNPYNKVTNWQPLPSPPKTT
jgi:hypothetical protein